VLPVEPPAGDDPVLSEERIIVTPHIAWASSEAARDVRVRAAEDVVRVLRGETPRYAVNSREVEESRRTNSLRESQRLAK
jgi:D-3-phosphoglycerate dehydrogenase